MTKNREAYYVLVIEDNPAHAELITDLLDKYFSPIIIHIVDTMDAAYDFLSQTSYHLLFTDSLVEGEHISPHIKIISEKYKNIPIIVITGSGSESVAAKLIKIGAKEYLSKTKSGLNKLPRVISRYLKPSPEMEKFIEKDEE